MWIVSGRHHAIHQTLILNPYSPVAASDFLVHLRVLKCIALLASSDRTALDAANTFGYDVPRSSPALVVMIGTTMTAPDRPLQGAVKAALTEVGPAGVRNALEYVYFTSARHLIARTARANVMRGLVAHAVRLHGAAVVPPIVPAGTGLIAAA